MTLNCIAPNIDWLSLVALLATLITALATFWTVLEVKKQRETSYHPEIYLGNQTVHLYAHKWKDTYLPFSYSNDKVKEFSDNDRKNFVNLDLHNVGFAVAKAIDYEWMFDIQKIIEDIHKVNRVGFFHVHIDKDFLEISAPQVEFNTTHLIANQIRKEAINYILPSFIEKTPTKILVPPSYIDLYLIYLSSALGYYSKRTEGIKEVRTHDFDIENFPSLNLKLSYKDLHRENS